MTEEDYRQRGMRALQDERYAGAVKDLNHALTLLPSYETDNRTACHVGLGTAHLELGELEEAVHHLSKAIELQPTYPRAGVLHRRQGPGSVRGVGLSQPAAGDRGVGFWHIPSKR